MINIESENLVLLKPENEVIAEFINSFEFITSLMKKDTENRRYLIGLINFLLNKNLNTLTELNIKTLNLFLSSIKTRGSNGHPLLILSDLFSDKSVYTSDPSAWLNVQSKRLMRLTFFDLWLRGMIVLPKSFPTITLPCVFYDQLVNRTPNQFIKRLASLHINFSSRKNNLGVDESIIEKAKSHWIRLLLNTNWNCPKSVSRDDIRLLIENGSGSRHSLLSRYYVNDFLSFLFSENEDLLTLFRSELEEITQNRAAKKESEKQARVEKAKRYTYVTKQASAENACILFASANSTIALDQLLEQSLTSHMVRKLFYQKDLDIDSHSIYSRLSQESQQLVSLIDTSFKAFIESKRLQNPRDHEFCLSILLSYVSVYLSHYFNTSEGTCENLPRTFNDFSCAYYVAVNAHLQKIISDSKNPPISLFNYVELIGEKWNWTWAESAYPRLNIFRDFFRFVEGRANVIKGANKFKCTITESDMPKTRRRVSTVKNVIPRDYFKVFLELLETLEYMVDHINGMAEGINPGIVNGKLAYPSHNELCESKTWCSIWGKEGSITPELNLSRLNFTPLINIEGKYYPLKRVKRFYTLTPYKFKGKDCQRATPHAARIALLMANTGIRQKHLLWLIKDEYDSAINSKSSALAPLIVSTDKSHSEWVSIVSRNVIEMCNRQREFYDKCEIESFKDDLWYGGKKNSRFGKFKPLFRLDTEENSWTIYKHFPKIMWTLQHFLTEEYGDVDCPELIYWKPTDSGKTPGKLHDHRMTEAEFNAADIDKSWKWELRSPFTPHGLRAAFVSDHIRFLPPSLIGRHLTGQSEALVWYYSIFDMGEAGDHQQLLINLLMKNEGALSNGEAPELAAKINEMNIMLAKELVQDTDLAISKNKLFSIASVDDKKNGIAILKAKKHAQIAFNSTHICPFNNVCPTEVIENLGIDRPCALCPYAIRGADMHLDAINAEKFKYIELLSECEQKLKSCKSKAGISKGDIEQLEAQFDRFSRDAYALEAIEQQLVHVREKDGNALIAHKGSSVKDMYEKLELDSNNYLFKRLIDVQNFPTLDSPSMQSKFAHLRYKIMMSDNNLEGILEQHDEPEHVQLSSLIHSMMSAKKLTVRDIYNLASASPKSKLNLQAMKQLGSSVGGSQ